ncbi:LuxR family transcriptional regulator [Streptomyces sp. HUAS TT20]|uniref:LuxR family transcriptional regulator n=1 Tax=Streptomyces sp. HUAS TT20 TaxID=3447509 RepID=UPI0021DB14D0|nr:LuxR family transcriptional regulator [Streptomyces sp. HUAS 15-9]UXY30524.1 LuxR C-terminal-related transcriptional regulator [Streptomyces sp. HUAS 15-9]
MRTDEAPDATARASAELLSFVASGLHREAAAAASLLRLFPPDDKEARLLRARALVLAGLPESALREYASVPLTARDALVYATALRLLGRWDEAERCLERSAPSLRTLPATASALECAALALDRGEPALGRTAQQWAQRALHEAEFGVGVGAGEGDEAGAGTGAGSDVDIVHARCLLAASYAAVGRFGAALDAADAAARLLDGLGQDALLRRLDSVYRLADALFYTGRRREAERRLGEALVRARDAAQEHVAGLLELGLARARLAAEDLASAGRWAERAAESARRTGGVPLAVDAALCLAQVRLAANDIAGALEAAETAVRDARALGGVWRDRAAARLREVRVVREHERPPAVPSDKAELSGGAGPLLDALSGREAQVAVLVSEGCTNQQIAARLRLSPKTVETHLSRIFKKLGSTSRAQVAHWVGLTAGPARDDGG